MEENKYLKYYCNKLVRISYKSDDGYEKLATGSIVDETDNKLIIKTVKDETVFIRYDLIGNIIELVRSGEKYGASKTKD